MRYPADEFTEATARNRATLDVGLCTKCGSPQSVQMVGISVAESLGPIGWEPVDVHCDTRTVPSPRPSGRAIEATSEP
jgi:hypothetical protein